MIMALWSNSNYDDDKGTRTKAIQDIEMHLGEAIEAIESALGNQTVAEKDKLDKENPFFAAAERGLQKVDSRIEKMKTPDAIEPEEEVDRMKGIDQS